MKRWEEFKDETLVKMLRSQADWLKYQTDATYHAQVYTIVQAKWEGYKLAQGSFDQLLDIQVVPQIGGWLESVKSQAQSLADLTNCPVTFTFNGELHRMVPSK